jgi:hypothetical protein
MQAEEKSSIVLYENKLGEAKLEVTVEGDSLWMTQTQVADLFGVTRQNISVHISNIYSSNELSLSTTRKENLRVVGNAKKTVYLYNLDVIISVGYKVNSLMATRFRVWATQILKEYAIKGFAMDDERLKGTATNYFEEWLGRVRSIRTSEQNTYKKITDIFSTSVDYSPRSDTAKLFFAMMQNKFQFAITEHTAAELITERVNAHKPYLGMTSWKDSERGTRFNTSDATIAKNYMSPNEIKQLELLTEALLSLAELKATRHTAMYMVDWVRFIDGHIKNNELPVLDSIGKKSHKTAEKKVKEQLSLYDAYNFPHKISDEALKVLMAEDATPQQIQKFGESVKNIVDEDSSKEAI